MCLIYNQEIEKNKQEDAAGEDEQEHLDATMNRFNDGDHQDKGIIETKRCTKIITPWHWFYLNRF
jgi:hypothetical protein